MYPEGHYNTLREPDSWLTQAKRSWHVVLLLTLNMESQPRWGPGDNAHRPGSQSLLAICFPCVFKGSGIPWENTGLRTKDP